MDTRISEITIPVIGLAKDGRVIYGPQRYDTVEKKNKQISTCDVDVCNGKYETDASSKQVYTYRATTFHPYLPGCFGPGAQHGPTSGGQTCSANNMLCGALVPLSGTGLMIALLSAWLL